MSGPFTITQDTLDAVAHWKNSENAELRVSIAIEEAAHAHQKIGFAEVHARAAKMKVLASCYWAGESFNTVFGDISCREREMVLAALDFAIFGRKPVKK